MWDIEWIAMITWDNQRHRMNSHDCVGAWMCDALGRVTLNRLTPHALCDWFMVRGTWTCGTDEYARRSIMRCTWTCDTEWIDMIMRYAWMCETWETERTCTWICETLGNDYARQLEARHRTNRHDYVWHLVMWYDWRHDTEWIDMIMWDNWRHLDMWDTDEHALLCEVLGHVTLNRLPLIHDVIGLYCLARRHVTPSEYVRRSIMWGTWTCDTEWIDIIMRYAWMGEALRYVAPNKYTWLWERHDHERYMSMRGNRGHKTPN